MKVLVAASGSEGNATIFESKGTRVLVDAGIGWQQLCRKIEGGGLSGFPHAIVVTHAHQDHVGNASRLAKRLRVPIYTTPSCARTARLGDPKRIRTFRPRETFTVGALTFIPIPVPHDAPQVALVVDDGKFRAGIATDLGTVPPSLLPHFSGCEIILIESNHCEELLEVGPYPPNIRARIRSSRGHLSNRQTQRFLRDLSWATHTVVLLHVSEANNTPERALECARLGLAGRRVHLFAAMRDDALMIDAASAPPAEAIGGVAPKARRNAALPGQMSLFR